ncbi:hypothetical protein FNF29_02301 [Cafeteria roenbergensis]|uniref:protein-synthesizing GTPase n=1 Tax=Cafeteria roenbergensis TaxID=33653 RepID=A0A5A8CNW2_CAFRO|nr:hypothetical protein FNF29_02301 [Cafeteria roenbergensis]|eukprot:KAA0154772.1 hypothetical protein FNF29_02301 [Cafeteria roenbergensis]
MASTTASHATAAASGAGGGADLPRAADGLVVQDLATLNPELLTPSSLEVISRQATINIGTIGHVAHGKSTIVKAISGVTTVKYKKEMARNITIKLGYANAKIFRSLDAPFVYTARGSEHVDEFEMTDSTGATRTMRLVRHVSFVDCPGHDILMATMLNGAAVMDAALLLIAANKECPQPQTLEHLAAVEIMQLQNIIVVQNKIDLVKPEEGLAHFKQIKDFVGGTIAESAPVIPVSAQLGYNVDLVSQFIARKVPTPLRDFLSTPRLLVIRSFDVNKPGHDARKVHGGVAGGSILQGVLRIGDEIEVRPGIVHKDSKTGRSTCQVIHSRITSLMAEENALQFAVPGGLIGVGTLIDPTLTRSDRLVGQVLGHRGKLPVVYTSITVSFTLLARLLGLSALGGKKVKVAKLTRGEALMVNVGSTSTGGKVHSVKGGHAVIELVQPVCTTVGEKVALSRKFDKNWRLIGWGEISDGAEAHVDDKTLLPSKPLTL